MNEILNSPIIKEGTVKIEIEQRSIIMLSVSVLITAVIIIMFAYLLRKKS